MGYGYILKEVAGPAGGNPPDTFQLLPYGRIELEGEEPAVVDEEGIAAVIDNFDRRGNDMVIDYEHQTLKDVEAPAAGWIRQLIDRGAEGIWAAVEWTDRAKEYLKNREYRYFSPVFWVSTGERRVVRIQHVALTNFPKINQLRPIVAKLGREEAREARDRRSRKYGIAVKEGGNLTRPGEWDQVADEDWLDPVNYRYPCPDAARTRAAAGYRGRETNQEQYSPEERTIINARLTRLKKEFTIGESAEKEEAKIMLEKLKKLLKLADSAGETEVTEAVTAVVAKNEELGKQGDVVACTEVLDALGLKKAEPKEAVISAVKVLAAKSTATDDLSGQVAKLSTQIAEMQRDDLVTVALKGGKTSPEELDKWGRNLALQSPEQFTAIVLSRAKGSVIPVDKLPEGGEKHTTAVDGAVLEIAKSFGNTAEDIKKYGGIEE